MIHKIKKFLLFVTFPKRVIFAVTFLCGLGNFNFSFARADEVLPAISQLEVRGIAHIALVKSSKDDETRIDIPEKSKNSFQYSVTDKDGQKTLVIESLNDKDTLQQTPNEMPTITIQIPQMNKEFHLTGTSHLNTKDPSKIYIDWIQTDTFYYTGEGNSLVVIDRMDVKSAYFKTKKMDEVRSSTSADFEIRDLDANLLDLNLEGSSNVDLFGKVNTLNIVANNDSETPAAAIDAEHVRVQDCNITLSYGSTLKTDVTQSLTGIISGRTSVFYHGNAKVSVEQQDSSKLVKVHDWGLEAPRS